MQRAHFEKDNDARNGSQGDYIFRYSDELGAEIVSIMFEMKNESDETATKKRSDDFLKELDKDELQILYEVQGYRNEAMRRLQAVEYINSKIPNEDKVKIMASDPHYLLLVNKIQTLTDDPRRKLVEKVALYHYFVRTDLCREERMPLV